MSKGGTTNWDARYAVDHYIFGTEPNEFVRRSRPLLPATGRLLAVADGEGRNGVFWAATGLDVLSIDGSPAAQDKARKLAAEAGVGLATELADLSTWPFPHQAFDVVAGIFIQFAGPELRDRMFAGMIDALKPGGILLLTGYRPEQLAYGTGGPRAIENLYTEELLLDRLAALDLVHLESHDSPIEEGEGHSGMSALIDYIGRKPA